ncbi:MAG: hypothetical protein QM831_28040 [Kofleriaceae bacterium]
MSSVRAIGSAVPALAVALLPKCPACLGAYLAVASSVGINHINPGVLMAVVIGTMALALFLLGRAAKRRHRWIAFGVACAGAAIVLGARFVDGGKVPMIAGVLTLYAGAFRIYFKRKYALPGKAHACHSM